MISRVIELYFLLALATACGFWGGVGTVLGVQALIRRVFRRVVG